MEDVEDNFFTKYYLTDSSPNDYLTGDDETLPQRKPLVMQSSSSKMALGMGITSGVLSVAALIFGIYTFFFVFLATTADFTSTQVSKLQQMTANITITSDNFVSAAGYRDGAGFTNDVTAKTCELSADLKIGTTTVDTTSYKVNDDTLMTDTGVSISDTKCTNFSVVTLDTTSVDSGTWEGQPIQTSKGGVGISTITPYAILVGDDTVSASTTGSYLISQGAGAAPIYYTLPYLANGEMDGDFSNLFPLAWLMTTPPVCYYTVVNNIVTFSASVALRANIGSPIVGPAVSYSVYGTPVIDTVVKGTRILINLTQGITYPMSLTATSCACLIPTLSGVNPADTVQFSFTIAYIIS